MIQEIFKLLFKGLKALFLLLFSKKKIECVGTNNLNSRPRIRVQFKDFQVSAFDITPIWEFAIDEEDEEGQDETTLRPCFDQSIADPSEGIYLVKAEFTTARGKLFSGFCSPARTFDLREIQPYMFTANGTVSFWCGMVEPDKKSIGVLYTQLGETKDTLFPIKFKTFAPTKGVKLEGQLDGFLWKPIGESNVLTVQ